MSVFRYLPSTQFTVIVLSIAVSGGLVLAAEKLTDDTPSREEASSLTVGTETTADWAETLREIQSQNSAYTIPPPPSENAVETLLNAAETTNITDSVGRTLFVNLSNAKAQGLGDDIPTQDKLIESAAEQIERERSAPSYTLATLPTTANTPEAQRVYGNTMMATLSAHPRASYYDTLVAIGRATDNNDKAQIAALQNIGAAYTQLAEDLSHVAVPQTLAPLHLQIVNNFAGMAELMTDMQLILDDPLRGLAGLQLYESLIQETQRVFTNIAQQFSSNGILFDKNEPGSTWSSLLP